jgi:hypothetical protein
MAPEGKVVTEPPLKPAHASIEVPFAVVGVTLAAAGAVVPEVYAVQTGAADTGVMGSMLAYWRMAVFK